MPTYAVWIDTARKEVDLDEPDCEITDVISPSQAILEALQDENKTMVVLLRDERTGRLYEAVCMQSVSVAKIEERPAITAPSAR